MALNYSCRRVFSVPENNLVSERNFGGFTDGVSERNVDAFGWNPWCSSQWDLDIINLLPVDPFNMYIGSTVTAISGWLDDLHFGYGNYGCETNPLTALLWSNAMRFRTNVVSRFGDDTYNAASGGLGGVSSDAGFSYRDGSLVFDDVGNTDEGFLVNNDGGSKDVDGGSSDVEDGPPHPALSFAFGYLGVRDLLSCQMVCSAFRYEVDNDPLLWQNIHIDKRLNKITDDVLLQLTSRAQGTLKSLSLVECSRITDVGLMLVLLSNSRITKLSVPGCTRLSIEGIISCLKAFKSICSSGLQQLKVGGIYGTTPQHYKELKFILNVDDVQQKDRKPRFYQRGNIYLSDDDDCAIDIEICPKCKKPMLVFDCPADGCQATENSNGACRACAICIVRCAQCGRCIGNSEYEETFCLDWLCSDCGK